MNPLSDTDANASAIQRIESLQADNEPEWGKMDCAQMLAHCQKPFLLAADELKMKRRFMGRLLGGWAKKKWVQGDALFDHNSPTDPTFRISDERDFEKERTRLVALVKGYADKGLVSKDPHPFFGPMSASDWDRLLTKHLDHHLRQFQA
jgi:hypothetical protein